MEVRKRGREEAQWDCPSCEAVVDGTSPVCPSCQRSWRCDRCSIANIAIEGMTSCQGCSQILNPSGPAAQILNKAASLPSTTAASSAVPPAPAAATGKSKPKGKKKKARGGEVYQAEKIMSHKEANGGIEYFIKWENWGHEHNTWEPGDNILDEELVEDYQLEGGFKNGAVGSVNNPSTRNEVVPAVAGQSKRKHKLSGTAQQHSVNNSDFHDEDYSEGIKIQVQEEDGSWRWVTLYRKLSKRNVVVLW